MPRSSTVRRSRSAWTMAALGSRLLTLSQTTQRMCHTSSSPMTLSPWDPIWWNRTVFKGWPTRRGSSITGYLGHVMWSRTRLGSLPTAFRSFSPRWTTLHQPSGSSSLHACVCITWWGCGIPVYRTISLTTRIPTTTAYLDDGGRAGIFRSPSTSEGPTSTTKRGSTRGNS